jgi:GTP pyrophosphokinase
MLSLKGLLEKISSYNPDADLELLKKAYHFSREAHCSQKRSEGSPYIKHPLEVAYILADMRMDVPSISAGLLHDTVEDTIVTIEDTKAIFGEEIAFIVNSLTKLSRVEFRTKKEARQRISAGCCSRCRRMCG